MVFGYARVSSADQNLERQLVQLREHIKDERYIVTDKASGKDFNRKGYNSLVGTADTAPMLHEGDLLLITSLDRLGRNYGEIKEQWEYITHRLKADIKVLDMPLLDTTQAKGSLDSRFIADLVLQILCYVAQKERESIRRRQEQGLAAMPEAEFNGKVKRYSQRSGKPTGRPPAQFPADWETVYAEWKRGEITATTAMKQLKLKRTTYYKLVQRFEEERR